MVRNFNTKFLGSRGREVLHQIAPNDFNIPARRHFVGVYFMLTTVYYSREKNDDDADESGKNPRIRIWNLKICWAKTCQLGPLYTITC